MKLIQGCYSLLAVCACCCLGAAEEAAKPNVVFILVDDLGWADLACYGNKFNESPNIDRLAQQGMRFTDAYAASPVCSSTRASLMTGRYPARVGITDFIPGHWRPWEKLIVPPIKNELPLAEVTIGEIMNSAGYKTAYYGKWHLGGEDFYPQHQGFDEALVQQGKHFGTKLGGTRQIKLKPDEYLADGITDLAIDFIKDNKNQPFFVYLSHYAVHIPLQAKPQTIEHFEDKARKQQSDYHPTYSAMIKDVDDSVGRLMKTLDDLGLTDRTMVIFFSDNGGLIQGSRKTGPIVGTNKPLRAEKGTVYEGGIREPLIVRFPGVIEAGGTCSVPVTSVDMLPTIMEMTGAEYKLPTVDGISLKPLLSKSGSGKLNREAIYWHYPHYHHMDPAGAIRAGDYKLIENFQTGQLELFNISKDIGETNNLATQMPVLADQLRSKLAVWRNSVGAAMPQPNPEYDPEKADQWQKRIKSNSRQKKTP